MKNPLACPSRSQAVCLMLFLSMLISTEGGLVHAAEINPSSPVRINEIMASNSSTLADEDGEYSDWIELYNSSDTPVNLAGWVLTDNPDNPTKWVFPDVWLQAKSCVIVFASEKDRRKASGYLHTNFKLSASGEYLALYDDGGSPATVFAPGFPALLSDQAYGYLDGVYAILTTPTPGNAATTAGGVLPTPQFSVNRGLFTTPFTLTVQSSDPTATLFYTLDGSTPSETQGIRYTTPLNITTTTVVRAIALKDGWEKSRVATSTYIFPDKVLQQPNNPPGYPSLWGPFSDGNVTHNGLKRLPADYEMDPELVNLAGEADRIKEGLHDLPTISLVTDKGYLFSESTDPDTGGIYLYTGPYGGLGSGWERPVSMEFINGANSSLPSYMKEPAFSQIDAGLRMQGQASRLNEKNPKHSFIMVFKEEYGPKKWNFPLYGEGFNAEQNKIIFRAGFGNSWTHWSHSDRVMSSYHSDIWIKDVQRAMGYPSSNSRFCNVYINGLFWGFYALSERLDKDYAQAYLNGEEADFDVVKDNASSVVDGTNQTWKQVVAMANAGLTTDAAYQRLRGNNPDGSRNPTFTPLVDVVNLADYMLLNFYGGNTDWDDHNWAVFYNKVQPDNGFRFLCWDGENVLENLNDNTVKENNDNCPSRVFQQLMANNAYKQLFADRVQRHCFNNGVLTPQRAAQHWTDRADQISKAIHAEAARWGDNRRDVFDYNPDATYLYSVADFWAPRQTYMRDTYFPQRTDKLIQQLRAAGYYPAVDAPTVTINGAVPAGSPVLPGDNIALNAPTGAIYYTLDGTDPLDWAATGGEAQTWTLAPATADKRVLVPGSDIGSTWCQQDFDDSSWTACTGTPGGVGFSSVASVNSLISLNVQDKMGSGAAQPNNSCYIRIPFTLDGAVKDKMTTLTLNLSYDDGYVAYLNGQQVAANNAPANPTWNASAVAGSDAIATVSVDLSAYINLLRTGSNVLAIHGMNIRSTSKDFLVLPELVADNSAAATQHLAETAQRYTGGFALQQSAHLKARTLEGSTWSALIDLPLLMTADYADLKITEIHYHPEDMQTAVDDTAPEFIEIKNTGTATIDLSTVAFTEGIRFAFTPGTSLKPDSFAVLSNNPLAFLERYGWYPHGRYEGNLSNSGETVTLSGLNGQTILSLDYEDGNGWPSAADGDGYSLVPIHINPIDDQTEPSSWRRSHAIGGSPGRDDLASTAIEPVLTTIQDQLEQNAPNPFRQETTLRFTLAESANVTLSVYNLAGQQVVQLVNEHRDAGSHAVVWQPNNDLLSGFYLCKMTVEGNGKRTLLSIKLIKQ
ncbi:MAG: T9SS type A sorting domain-containing protein [Bacteroidales bacterium]|nr:T9SS type A sorting domain-containing protein [Bacteroidales bacterium]